MSRYRIRSHFGFYFRHPPLHRGQAAPCEGRNGGDFVGIEFSGLGRGATGARIAQCPSGRGAWTPRAKRCSRRVPGGSGTLGSSLASPGTAFPRFPEGEICDSSNKKQYIDILCIHIHCYKFPTTPRNICKNISGRCHEARILGRDVIGEGLA